MIELGKTQELEVMKLTPKGAYLNEKNKEESKDVFIPEGELPKNISEGDTIDVFVYRDEKEKVVATTKKPDLEVGEIGFLKLAETTRIGGFMKWGLDKDLFLPFSEQIGKVEKGRKYLVGVYIDKTNRLCATMKIKNLLSDNSPYRKDDKVKGTIYSINREIGVFVAVDNKYDALIPRHELFGAYRIGDTINARVTKVRKDGKLNLSLRKKVYKQMDKDARVILNKLQRKGGELPLNDYSSPAEIKEELNMSKGAFKRAVGRLLKEGQVEFSKKGIRLVRM
ncbi:MAG TPA: S1-like domain-containing RNA-binding protein [Tissierellales bacterium]|nr:S1-like domain-containing RNA-binding protein [Tissierellales bacterium]